MISTDLTVNLMGIDVPAKCEGGVVYEVLEDPNWHLTEMRRQAGAG